MSWVFLGIAIVLELCGTTLLKVSQGFAKMLPALGGFAFYALSLTFMNFALKRIDVSIVYAIWSGLGMAAIATIGMVVFHEAITPMKVLCILLIIVGVVGLSLQGGVH